MSDAFDKLPDAFDGLSEGGAEGGAPDSAASKPLIDVKPEPIDPVRAAAEAQQKKTQLASEISGGQSLKGLSQKDLEAYRDRMDTGTAADALSVLRGAPFVGEHLDAITGAAQSGALSGPEYEKKRDLARQTLDAAVSHSPKGPIVGSLLLGPKMPASVPGRIAMGTAQGLSQGIGEPATLDAVTPWSLLKHGAGGAALSTMAEGLNYGGSGAEQAMKNGAETQALKAAGLHGGITNAARKKLGADTVQDARDIGRSFLDEGLIPFAGSKESVAERANQVRAMSGNSIGAQLGAAQASGKPFDYQAYADAARAPLQVGAGGITAVADRASSKARDLANDLEKQGTVTPGDWREANRAKSDAWDAANFDADAKAAPVLYRKAVGSARNNIEDQVRGAAGNDAADALAKANKSYGVASDALKLANDQGTREAANSTIGMRELMAMATGEGLGAAGGHPGMGAAGGAAGALLANWSRKHGNAAAARTLDAAAVPLGRTLQAGGTAARALEPATVEESERPGGMLNRYFQDEEQNPRWQSLNKK